MIDLSLALFLFFSFCFFFIVIIFSFWRGVKKRQKEEGGLPSSFEPPLRFIQPSRAESWGEDFTVQPGLDLFTSKMTDLGAPETPPPRRRLNVKKTGALRRDLPLLLLLGLLMGDFFPSSGEFISFF